MNISVARTTQLRRLIVGIAGLLQCTHLLAFAPNSLTICILNTAVVFSSKSRSGYVLNPDLLSEVDFCRLYGFGFTDKRRKKNKGEFAKMFESGWFLMFPLTDPLKHIHSALAIDGTRLDLR